MSKNKAYWKNWTQDIIKRSKEYPVLHPLSYKEIQCSKVANLDDIPEELVAQALKYHQMGLPVVPINICWNKAKNRYDKQILTEWKHWKTKKQTDDEFRKLGWSNANGFGVILGWQTPKGYLCVVDYDVKGDVPEEILRKGSEVLGFLPPTNKEYTANKGLHYIYFSIEPVKTDRRHHSTCGLELLGENLVIMAPSQGYKTLNDDAILQVDDLTSIFNNAITTIGLDTTKKHEKKARAVNREKKVRPCVEALLKNNALNHEERCVVAFEFLNSGYPLEEVLHLFRYQTDFDYDKTKQQLEHAISTGYLPYSEQTLKELGVCLGPSCPQYGKQQVYTPSVVLEDGRIAEQGYDGKAVYFLVYNPETEDVIRQDFIETDESVYLPILNDDVTKGLVKFPSEATEYESNAKLDGELKAYLNRWHEQLDPVQRQLDVYYVKETYVKDLMPQIPYRRNLATFGSGKSAFLEVLGSICYRPFTLAGSSTEAAIRRKFNLWQGTGLIDEADFKNSSLFDVLIKILNIGYDRKTGYYQCCDENDVSKVLNFNVYGPKVIATRERYGDVALESRCLTFIGRDAIGSVPLYRMDKFEDEAQTLRNKLLMWRFRNYQNLKDKLHILEDVEADIVVYGGKINARNRVKQLILPLLLIAESDADKQRIVDFANEFNSALANLDEEQGMQEKIVQAIHKLFSEQKISEKVYKVYLHSFAEALEILDDKERTYWSRKLAKYFRKRTDFQIRTGNGNRKYVLLPAYWIKEILKKALPPDSDNLIQYLSRPAAVEIGTLNDNIALEKIDFKPKRKGEGQ